MRRLSALLAGAALVVALVPGLGTGVACAGEGGSAALVIDTGERVLRLCVALPTGSVSGIQLIELAGDQHGLAYSLGYGGGAVCSLAGVGPDGSDCFADYPRFWGYWRGDGEGGWTWSNVGAGSTTVRAGDVEGWSWGEGNDGETHPRPPSVRFEEVCAAEPSPSPTRASPPPEPSAPPRSPSPSPQREGEPSSQREGERGAGRERDRSPSPSAAASPSPTVSAPTSPPRASPVVGGSGPGAGLAVAGGLAAGLGLAALLVRRRRGR